MAKKYPQHDIVTFGKHLVDTGDLDPVYIVLRDMKSTGLMSGDQLSRWLVAYWAYYSCGAACWLSEREGDDFWAAMNVAADNWSPAPHGGRWERGHERRHFRAETARRALRDWMKYPNPEAMVDYIVGDLPKVGYKDVAKRVKEHNGCGPWIAWKVADMLNVLGYCEVDFSSASLAMYRDPVKAAHMLHKENYPPEVHGEVDLTDGRAIETALAFLQYHMGDLTPPHAPHRYLQLEEYETVLCKWKSHRNGHYPLFNDLTEIGEGVSLWAPYSTTAKRFLDRLPDWV